MEMYRKKFLTPPYNFRLMMFPKVSTSEVHLLSQPFSLQLAFWSDADVVTMGFNLLFIFCVWNC